MRRAALIFAAGCILNPDRDRPLRGPEYCSGVHTAVDAQTGFPLEGVGVEFSEGFELPFWQNSTDRFGRVRFSITYERDKPLTVQLRKRGYVRKRVLFDADDFCTSSERARSRKTVELRRGRGSETLDLSGGEINRR